MRPFPLPRHGWFVVASRVRSVAERGAATGVGYRPYDEASLADGSQELRTTLVPG